MAMEIVPARTPARAPTGYGWVSGDECQTGNHVQPEDLLLVDFGQREISTGGALYLVQTRDGNAHPWRGCRYMMRTPDGIAIDQDGRGEWATVSSLDATAWRIVGAVRTVYRPTLAACK